MRREEEKEMRTGEKLERRRWQIRGEEILSMMKMEDTRRDEKKKRPYET